MNIKDFSEIHKYASKKFGMGTAHGHTRRIGPTRRMEYHERPKFIKFLNCVTPIGNAIQQSRIKISNVTDNIILTQAPLVVDNEYVDPKSFYSHVLENNNHEFPKGCTVVLSEIINLACATLIKNETRVKYLFLRKIADQIFLKYPDNGKAIRMLQVNSKCQVYLFGDRFMFITYGDTGAAHNPKGHIDLFGFDLHGVVEAYLTGGELHSVNYKMPTMLRFKNIPSNDSSSGGAFMVSQLAKPIEHTWVEVNGRGKRLPEEITLDFNSVSQNYVPNPKSVLTDARWALIKSMLKFKGKYSATNKHSGSEDSETSEAGTNLKQAS